MLYAVYEDDNLNVSLQVGIIGLGGFGQMGIRQAKAMGTTVTAVSSSVSKKSKVIEYGEEYEVMIDHYSTLQLHDDAFSSMQGWCPVTRHLWLPGKGLWT